MIVDTMTLPEISKYLWKNVFTQDSYERTLNRVHRNKEKYIKEFKRWKRNLSGVEKYKIYSPIIARNGHFGDMVTVFYTDTLKHLDCVIFTKFIHRGRKYVAMKLGAENSVLFFTWHSLQRYSERFLGDPDPSIDDIFIGDMLIFNTQYVIDKYTYEGKESLAILTTDGIFLGEFCDFPYCLLAKTFISQKEYFECQKEIDSELIEVLKDMKMRLYGDTIDR